MRYPRFLPDGGTIGFIAPSFGCNIEPYYSAFHHAMEVFRGKGYQIKNGPNCFAGDGIGISSTPENCAGEFVEAWQDPESDVLISCGGGELMCEILPLIDFDMIKRSPAKWFEGYSDNTNLAFLLATMCDTAAVYGPCAAAFGMEPWHASLHDAFAILSGKPAAGTLDQFAADAPEAASKPAACFSVQGYEAWELESKKDEEHPLEPYNTTEPCIRKRFPDEDTRFSGRLIGGCLDILCMLCGTKFDHVAEFNERYAKDGIIWFLESCDLNVLSIRRALWQLDQAGWFQHVKGFLIGRPMNGEALFGLDRFQAVTGVLEKYGVPVLMDLDIGHIPPMMPLIEGSMADVQTCGNEFQIDMRLE